MLTLLVTLSFDFLPYQINVHDYHAYKQNSIRIGKPVYLKNDDDRDFKIDEHLLP